MSVSLLFVALLAFLFRFDDSHPQKDRIYRITTQLHDKKENPHYASASVSLAQRLTKDITGVEKVISLLLMLVLGLTTILSQTLKAANANPVDNLSVSS